MKVVIISSGGNFAAPLAIPVQTTLLNADVVKCTDVVLYADNSSADGESVLMHKVYDEVCEAAGLI